MQQSLLKLKSKYQRYKSYLIEQSLRQEIEFSMQILRNLSF